jgi:hypothetical protein
MVASAMTAKLEELRLEEQAANAEPEEARRTAATATIAELEASKPEPEGAAKAEAARQAAEAAAEERPSEAKAARTGDNLAGAEQVALLADDLGKRS